MSAPYEYGEDSYSETLTSSPEGVNITSQPQPQEVKKPDGNSACSHWRKIPFSTVMHDGKGHEASRPLDCVQCGQDLASMLVSQLSLGVTDPQSVSAFQFRDVMVLTQDTKISDVCGMVQGLRDARLPVRVVGEEEADVVSNLADVNEVVVAWRGLASSGIVRRVIVFIQPEASEPQSSLGDIRPVSGQAEHIIWVKHVLDNGTTTDDVTVDVVDHVPLEELRPLTAEENHAVNEENHIAQEVNYSLKEARFVDTVTKPPSRYQGRGTTTSSRDLNNCCDHLCLDCCQDVGESGCILCCPCCGDLGNWCEDCCRGFGHSLNNCVEALCCDCSCCSSGDSYGSVGGCDCDCGDCDCDCGDCNCDCGSCDCGSCDCGSCVIM